jgi:3-phytase
MIVDVRRRLYLPIIVCLCFFSDALAQCAESQVFEVPAIGETAAAQQQGDAADDAEVWRNADQPAQSRIFATDKKSGLMVLDLSGRMIEFLAVGRLNNVDLRSGWIVNGADKVLVAASDRTRLGISLFLLDPKTLYVSHLSDSFVPAGLTDPYGLCLYRSRKDARLHAIVIGKDGEVRQFALQPNAAGGVEGSLVRSFAVGSIAEGCVADDRTGFLYIAEEGRGIWRYGAEPESRDARDLVAPIDGTNLVADIEGLTLAPTGQDGGYLVASVQGNSTFALISLPEGKLAGRFRIAANPEKDVDLVTGTDGLAVMVGSLGPGLPDGLLVAQDDDNTGATQNFKLVSWSDVLSKLGAGKPTHP